MSFFATVELEQQYLTVVPPAFDRTSLGLSTISSAVTTTTNSFQYLPRESSSSSALQSSKDLDRPQDYETYIDTYTKVGQQPFTIHDDVLDISPAPRGKSIPSPPTCLANRVHSIRQTARLLLQWCREKLSQSTLPWQADFFTERVGDSLESNDDQSWQYARLEVKTSPGSLGDDENIISITPQYVIDYAPLVYLYSGEQYWPCDMGEHLHHITPQLNFTPVPSSWQHPRLENLDLLNQWDFGKNVFLTSNDNVKDHPEWLAGEKNIPIAPKPFSHQVEYDSISQVAEQESQVGRSDAPAVLVVVDKGHGIVDAFWFFFYSFNLGNVVLLRFGNHVGDWEHTVVRFHNGKPKAIFVSEHFFGQAYTYQAVEKIGRRPVVYSASGSHAMYATPGTHSYILPWGLLHDETDKGPLWDPALNSHMYTYDPGNYTLRVSKSTPLAPVGWFNFAGHWGDKQYPIGDSRQYVFAGNYHYVSGPLGPKFKNLGRRKICQGPESERCDVKNWLGGSRLRRVHRPFEKGEASAEERERYLTGMGSS